MKFTVIVLTICCFFYSNLFAQTGWYIELLATPGLSMGGKYEVPNDISVPYTDWSEMHKAPTFRLHEGILIGNNFDENMGFSIGVENAPQGQNYKNYNWTLPNNIAAQAQKSSNLNYLKIPVLINVVWLRKKRITLCSSFGFYLGFLLNYEDKLKLTESNGDSFYSDATEDIVTQTSVENSVTTMGTYTFQGYATTVGGRELYNTPFKVREIGGIISFGMSYKLSQTISIPIEAVYQIGFNDVKNEDANVSFGNYELYYWQNAYSNSPNQSLPYHNGYLGLKTGLVFHF